MEAARQHNHRVESPVSGLDEVYDKVIDGLNAAIKAKSREQVVKIQNELAAGRKKFDHLFAKGDELKALTALGPQVPEIYAISPKYKFSYCHN